MGTFVLGIIFGWVAEWLFFNFWLKKDSTSTEGCAALRAEINAKNSEIAALKAASSSTSTAKAATKPATATKSVSKTTAKNKPPTKTKAKKPATKKTTTTKKISTKKTVAKKATTKKASTAKKSTTSTAKKSSAARKASIKIAADRSAAKSGDDLTLLSGIGPSMSATLGELGIKTYKKLAEMDDDILRDMLEASGARLNNNKEAMDTWNEQATFADKGDFVSLKKLQDSLNG